ncbi:MAG: tRNA uracil 4-sulfurtransferase ThiI [Candidatus Pacearchaeota archaeon]
MKILLHVSGEVGTKGKNRIEFERKLARNIKLKTKAKITRAFGSFLLEIEPGLKALLKSIPGIAWIAECIESEKSLEGLEQAALKLVREKRFSEFDIEVRRAWKGFELTSQEVRQELIKKLVQEGLTFNPKSKNKIYVEINKDWFVLFSEKEKGVGGLPTSTSGKALALLSGGIDSAVASFLAMKKGFELIFLHFHNYPSNDYKIIDEKIISLVKKLNDFQLRSKLYIISFVDAQKEIIKAIQPKYRMMCYRWLMFKIAEVIASKEKAKVLVSGDSLGQVASQTPENLSLIIKSSSLPIFMPLLTFDKAETIELAKKIGTYEISIMHYADCCSFMIAKHPATKLKQELFDKIIKKIKAKAKKLVAESIKNARVEIIR